MQESVAGIDLGGTFTKFGLVTRRGELLASNCIPTDSSLPYQEFFKTLYSQISDLTESLSTPITLRGIGVGAPTGNSFSGTIRHASNLDWPGEIPVIKVLKSCSNLPAVLVNDADAAAMGEMLYGAARGMKNFILVTIGTGLGCGIVVNGELVIGHGGHAGEIGHSTVFFDGRPCGCGRKGCLETYVSAPGIIYTASELLKNKLTDSRLRRIPVSELGAKKITEAALKKDALAVEACEYTGKILGLKLADVVAFLDPEAIFISGGLAKAGALIMDPVKTSMENHLLGIYKNRIEILPSGLAEKNAAILGSAANMWNELDEKN